MAYWPACETVDSIGEDNLAFFSLQGKAQASATVAGPVNDGETAAQVEGTNSSWAAQGFLVSKVSGTIALWAKGAGSSYPLPLMTFDDVTSYQGSGVRIKITSSNIGTNCYTAELTNAGGTAFDASACGFSTSAWHSVAMTWDARNLKLYVDGALQTSVSYTGALVDNVYFYRLFSPYGNLTLAQAKMTFSGATWDAATIASFHNPTIRTPPAGGLLVTTQQLGTIHRDVLGVGDYGANLSTQAAVNALRKGLGDAGVTAVRYASGFGGAEADIADWHPDAKLECYPFTNYGTRGHGTFRAQTLDTLNNIDAYVPQVAGTLGLDVIYTVNFGSNPPACTAGGDPIANGADLVRYLNRTKGYEVKKFEIGNEDWYYGTMGSLPLVDWHNNQWFPRGDAVSTYIANSAAFYDAMKAVDPTIEIAVPMLPNSSSYNSMANYEFPLLRNSAKWDAGVIHAYPIQKPSSDGAMLYQERLAAGTSIRGYIRALQTQMLSAGKNPEKLWMTEWDQAVGGSIGSKQATGAATPLFAVVELAEFMRAGLEAATFWAQSEDNFCNTYQTDTSNYGAYSTYSWTECPSFGLVHTGNYLNSGNYTTQGMFDVGMKDGDLYPVGRGFQVLSQSGFVVEGEHMLRTVVDQTAAPWLLGYGATHGSSYALILINRDRDSAHTVPVQLAGKSVGVLAQQWSYGRQQYDYSAQGDWSRVPVHSTVPAWFGVVNITLPPWSANVVIF